MGDYGVDPTGKPIGQGQPTTGQQTGCAAGQKKDDQGNCVAADPGPAQPSQQDTIDNYWRDTTQSGRQTLSQDELAGIVGKYANQGISFVDGSRDKVRLPNGQIVDSIQDSGPGGLNKPSWSISGGQPGQNGQPMSAASGGPLPAVNPGGQIQSFLSAGAQASMPGNYSITPYTGSTALPTYQPFQYSTPAQFSNSVQAPTADLIQKMLASEGSMNPAVVAQMKEAQKGSALTMADQLKAAANTNAASRGVAGGTNLGATLGGIDANTIGNISKGYRDTDIAAAQQNQADKMNAIGASNGFSQQLLNQYLGENQLKQTTEAGQAAEQSKQFSSEQAKAADEYQRYLSGEQLGMTSNDQAFSHWLASQGLTLNYQNAAMLADQFNKTYGLNVGKFLAGQ